MRRHRHPIRLMLAMLMMLGFMTASTTYALAGEEAPDGTPAGTAVAEADDTDDSSVSALPETGNDPESGSNQMVLMISAIAAAFLVLVAVIVRRARLN